MEKKNQKEHIQDLEEMAEIQRVQQRKRKSYHDLESWKTDLFSDVFEEAERRAEEKWEEYPQITGQMSRLYEEFSVIPDLLEGDAELEERNLTAKEVEGLMTYLFLENERCYMIKYEIYLRGVRDGHWLQEFLKG